jgi:hypothetical protein
MRLTASARKESSSFLVSLDRSTGKPPASLQCDFVVPPAIAIAGQDIQLGSAAASGDKNLTCGAAKTASTKPGAVRYTCIIAGGSKSIPNGPILVVYYRPQKASSAPVRVGIEKVLAVSADGSAVPLPDSEAILALH